MRKMWLKEPVVLLALIVTASGFIQNNFLNELLSTKKDDQRLPNNVIPSSYSLKLIPNIEDGHFSGSVHINLTCQERTNIIVLHASQELYINHELVTIRQIQNSVKSHSKHGIRIVNISRNTSSETVNITLQENLKPRASYELYFHFNSTFMSFKTEGFFRSRYSNEVTQQKSWYAGTKFSPKHARRVFPCFDEPAFKATFQISIIRPVNMITLSVMPLQSTEISEKQGFVWDNFPPTPPLSTFSFGFFIGDFESNSSVDVSNTKIQFYYKKSGNAAKWKTALEMTSELFDFLQKFFDVSFPVPKLDIVIIPDIVDVRTPNSMGLILVPEAYFDNDAAYLDELIDQWILHMTTPNWWSDFEITSSIGSYFTKIGYVQIINKENWYPASLREYYNVFSSTERYYASSDSTEVWRSARGEIFLKMLYLTLTDSTFRKSFSHFISAKMYGTYTEENLWASFTQQGHADRNLPESITVEALADSWIHQNYFRFPVVTVTRDYEKNSVALEQNVFTLPNDNVTEEEQKLLWWIPITYLTPEILNSESFHPVSWMKDRNFNVNDLTGSNSFIIINPNDAGMFLVNYDQHNWELITQQLFTSKSLPEPTRIKILHDSFLLAMGDKIDFGTALNISLILHNVRDPSVWISMLSLIEDFRSHISWTPIENKFNTYMHYLLAQTYESMTGPLEPYDLAFKRTVHNILCETAYLPCMQELYREMIELMPAFPVTDNETQSFTPCPRFLSKTDDFSEWLTNALKLSHHVYVNDTGKVLVKQLSHCPGFTMTVHRILNTFLEDGNKMADQEIIELIHFLRESPESSNLTFQFVLKHFDELKEKFESRRVTWVTLLLGPSVNWKTQEQLDMVINFRDQYKEKVQDFLDRIDTDIERITKHVEWGNKYFTAIENWFNNIFPLVIKQGRKSTKSGRRKKSTIRYITTLY